MAKIPSFTRLTSPAIEDLSYIVDTSAGAGKSIDMTSLAGYVVQAPGHRLTLTSGTPITTADVASSSVVYYTPCIHNSIWLYTSSTTGDWVHLKIPEIGYALSGMASGFNLDMFARYFTFWPAGGTNTFDDTIDLGGAGFNNGGVLIPENSGGGLTAGTSYYGRVFSGSLITLHPTLADALAGTNKVNLTASITTYFRVVYLAPISWASDNARTSPYDVFDRVDGLLLLNADHTLLYLGTFRSTGLTTTTDTAKQRFLYNEYNQVPRLMENIPAYNNNNAQNTFTHTGNTFANLNAGTNNKIEFIVGSQNIMANACAHFMATSSASGATFVGIAKTGVTDITREALINTSASGTVAVTRTDTIGTIGYHYYGMVARVQAGTSTFSADRARNGATADPAESYIRGWLMQ